MRQRIVSCNIVLLYTRHQKCIKFLWIRLCTTVFAYYIQYWPITFAL